MEKAIKNKQKNVYCVILTAIIIIIVWFQLEICSGYTGLFDCFQMEFKYILLNIMTNGIIVLVFFILINRIWIANIVFCSCGFLISVVNYYMIQFKSSPFTIFELKNFRTAANVITAYEFKIDKRLSLVICLFLLCISICFHIRKKEKSLKHSLKEIIARDIILSCLCLAFLYIGYFSPNPIKPEKVVGWSWIEAYHKYGYLACSIEMLSKTRNVVDKPDDYSEEQVKSIVINPKKNEVIQTPDIILILNESFYDLRQITNVKTDTSYLSNIEEMKNTVRGYTIVPSSGGGTNNSEYELLTSNSLQLMKGITPFNVLDMQNANSIVSHLKSLGYKTLGAHSESAANYLRGRAYSAMGFDEIHFDTDFIDIEYYDQRWFETDESLYKNLLTWYQNMPIDSPKFMYLLTIQNHGGWDMNPPESDTVRVQNDYGKYTQEINEFLSCINLTDHAFKQLTEYFELVDRPVVVCMVGDHSPSFAGDVIDGDYTPEEQRKRLRSTPFVIWTNYDIPSKNMGYISMNYLMPTILDIAQIAKSPYYDYLLQIREELPILTSYDVYYDKCNNEYSYDEGSPYSEVVNNYFYLEYNNLQNGRLQSFFDVYPDNR